MRLAKLNVYSIAGENRKFANTREIGRTRSLIYASLLKLPVLGSDLTDATRDCADVAFEASGVGSIVVLDLSKPAKYLQEIMHQLLRASILGCALRGLAEQTWGG